MLPAIALVGRPNVGKSTLFNYLTKSKAALVADYPGLTRDRQYGFAKRGPAPFIVVDTGGVIEGEDALADQVTAQAWRAIEEADAVIFMVDARDGLTAADEEIANKMRRRGIVVRLAVNKTDGLEPIGASAEFNQLGIGKPWPIAALQGRNINALLDAIWADLPEVVREAAAAVPDDGSIRVAVIGRPNAGKSTLINRMLGEERVVASDIPGTTRDSVFIPFERDEQAYTLIDTAGVRRRSRIDERIEKDSVTQTLRAIDTAHVVIAMLDAQAEISEQDARLIGLSIERGRALVVCVNKWDGLHPEDRDSVKDQLDMRLPFIGFARLHFASALHGTGVGDLFASIRKAYEAAMADIPTPRLTEQLELAIQQHQPPLYKSRRAKLRYAHQGGKNPPIIVIHGSSMDRLPETYKRYLVNWFRDAFKLQGTPLRIELRSSSNPYEGKRSNLTPRQEAKKRREAHQARQAKAKKTTKKAAKKSANSKNNKKTLQRPNSKKA